MKNQIELVESLLNRKLHASNKTMVSKFSLRDLATFQASYHDSLREFDKFIDQNTTSLLNSKCALSLLINAPTPCQRMPQVYGEFRPILLRQVHKNAAPFDDSSSFENISNAFRIDIMKRNLLYSHKVVIPDALFWVNQFFGDEKETEWTKRGRLRLTGYLDFLYSIRPLVKKQIVLFYPEYEYGSLPGEAFYDKEFVEWIGKDQFDEEKSLRCEVAHEDILRLLFYCVRYGASCTLDQGIYEPILSEVLRFGKAMGGQFTVTKENMKSREQIALVNRLAQISIPNLGNISIDDIVAVRSQSEAFNHWRDLLSEGIQSIEETGDPGLVSESVKDSLARGKEAIDQEIKKSSLLSSAKESFYSFAIGAIAGVALGDALKAIATGSLTATLSILKEFLVSGKDRSAKKSLLKHYASFN